MTKTVYLLGAGFSKKAKAPLQSEIIKDVFELDPVELDEEYRELFIKNRNSFKRFLQDVLFIARDKFKTVSLEDLYTPIDRCILDNISFRNISPKNLMNLRYKINALIVIMMKHKLDDLDLAHTHIGKFARHIVEQRKQDIFADPAAVLSTNWDISIDNALRDTISPDEGMIDYCCNVTPFDREEKIEPGLWALGTGKYNMKLLKLHGSMNWLHCKRCQRLFVTFFNKIAVQEYVSKPVCWACEENYRNELSSDGGSYLTNQLIMPTFLKDLNNVQLKLIWQNAGIELSEASRIVFMGYSLPMADFELRQLLARTVRHTAEIDVVLHPSDKPSKNADYEFYPEYRYKSFFGKRPVNFYYEGVEEYVNEMVGK